MADNRSGSRWEPDPEEQPTQKLADPMEPAAAVPAPKRRIPGAVLAVAIVAAATIGGGAVGLALAGNGNQEVSDTAVTAETPNTDGMLPGGEQRGDGFAPHGRDGGRFGHHGPGGH